MRKDLRVQILVDNMFNCYFRIGLEKTFIAYFAAVLDRGRKCE